MHGSYTSFIFFSLGASLFITHFSFVSLVFVFFYVTILIVTMKVKSLNYAGFFLY